MTIDEAIQRYEEAVQWEQYSMRSENINKAAEHRQLAEWLKELKRLRAQEPCEDAVSREAVYDAMVEKGQRSRRYKLGEIWELNGGEIREALHTIPSVTPKLVECEDAVSRHAVIDIIRGYDEKQCELIGTPNDSEVYAYARGLLIGIKRNINALPSVTPKPRTGEWIPVFDGKFHGGAYWFKCSECSRVVLRNGGWNFCPKCGAKMKGGGNDRA